MRTLTNGPDRRASRRFWALAAATVLFSTACGDDGDAGSESSPEPDAAVVDDGTGDDTASPSGGFAGSGSATVTVQVPDGEQLDYVVDGTCLAEGDDLTFTAAGDPSFTLGVKTGGAPAVGNFNSASEGVGFLIGSDPAVDLTVTVGDGTFTVEGDFTVLDGTVVAGSARITCSG